MKGSIYFFLGAFLIAWALNEINVRYIKNVNPKNEQRNGYSLVEDATIYNIDNLWYLTQVDHLLNGRDYTLDPTNPYMSVRRTPGYSLFFLAHKFFLGKELAHQIVRYTQMVFFALCVVLFRKAIYNFTGSQRMGTFGGIIYGTSIYHIQWLYYTITEAIHPQLLVVALFFLSKYSVSKQPKFLFWCGVFAGITTLVRPVDGFVLPFFFLFAFLLAPHSQNLFSRLIRPTYIVVGFTIILAPWVIRNYVATKGELVLLEKYYHDDPMNMGKGQIYFHHWWSSWDQSKAVTEFWSMVNHSKNDSLTSTWIDNFVVRLPDIAFRGYKEQELREALHTLMLCHREKVANGIGFKLPHPNQRVLMCEDNSKDQFFTLIKKYRESDPLRYYAITPLKSAKEYVVQSNTTAWAMLNPQGRTFNTVQWLTKTVLFLENIILYLAIATLIFVPTTWNYKLLFIGFPLANFLFFTVFVRYAEVRYTLQSYSFMFIALCLAVFYFYERCPTISKQQQKRAKLF